MIPAAVADSAITDENGNYSFTGVSAGTYTMICRHPDYRPASINTVIRKDTAMPRTYRLRCTHLEGLQCLHVRQ